jgi:glycosyltransferase involved in cell wall biosynthesis
VVCISRHVRDGEFARGLQCANTVCIHNGVDRAVFHPRNGAPDRVREQLGLAPNAFVVGAVGRLVRWKGQDVLLKAAARLTDRLPDLRVLIAGSAPPRDRAFAGELRRLIRDLRLQERVTMLGQTDDVPSVMQALDLLVLPSREPEPFGRVVVEAMACGKPVVATARGGPLEIVVPERTGLLVMPDAPAALAGAIERLASDPDGARAMGRAGQRRVEEHFTAERTAWRVADVYRSCLHPGLRRA